LAHKVQIGDHGDHTYNYLSISHLNISLVLLRIGEDCRTVGLQDCSCRCFQILIGSNQTTTTMMDKTLVYLLNIYLLKCHMRMP